MFKKIMLMSSLVFLISSRQATASSLPTEAECFAMCFMALAGAAVASDCCEYEGKFPTTPIFADCFERNFPKAKEKHVKLQSKIKKMQ